MQLGMSKSPIFLQLNNVVKSARVLSKVYLHQLFAVNVIFAPLILIFVGKLIK